VEKWVSLIDLDHPNEPLQVEVIACDEKVLRLAVPYTSIQFNLYRRESNVFYEGSLGGRSFCFIPNHGKRESSLYGSKKK